MKEPIHNPAIVVQNPIEVKWGEICGLIVLVLISALCAGLTIGFFSLDALHLQVLSRAGTETERKQATKVLEVMRNHHVLLVTLLLWNAGVNEALPILLEDLVSPVVAIVLSVTVVLMFGEIVPQAACAKYALPICAAAVPLVKFLMFITGILSYPIAGLLDRLVGEDSHSTRRWRRDEIREVLKLHAAGVESEGHSLHLTGDIEYECPLSHEEGALMVGALALKDKVIGALPIVPLEKVEMIERSQILSDAYLTELRKRGHSRYPVFEGSRANIVGFLIVKSLLGLPDNTPLSKHPLKTILWVTVDEPLIRLYKLMCAGRSHMAAVKDTHGKVIGVVTLEDVFEALLNIDIRDDTEVKTPLNPPARGTSFRLRSNSRIHVKSDSAPPHLMPTDYGSFSRQGSTTL